MDEIDSHHDHLPKQGNSIVERIEHVYLMLEVISQKDAENFTNSGRSNLRKAQAELQRIRLLLYDLNGKPSEKPPQL